MKLSHKYDIELDETKKNSLALREKLDGLAGKRQAKVDFIKAVRSFMEMQTLNPIILRELIDKIEVHQIEGTGKNRTQRGVIHYRLVGCLEIPEWYRKRKVTLESRQGVAVKYLPRRNKKERQTAQNDKPTNQIQAKIGKKYRVFITFVMNTRYGLSDKT